LVVQNGTSSHIRPNPTASGISHYLWPPKTHDVTRGSVGETMITLFQNY
jgi:hypothetical protein